MKIVWLVVEIGFAVATLTIISLFCAYAWPDKEFGLSGWMQAFGSVAAVGVAIWVSTDQHRRQEVRDRQREDAELDGMLRSIRSEIEAAINSLQRQVGTMLQESRPGTPFLVTFPIVDQPFPVYHGLIPKLGMIKDGAVRKQLVDASGRGQGLVMTFRYNSELIEDYNESRRRAAEGNKYDQEIGEAKVITLITYADQLRINQRETLEEIWKLLAMLPAD